MLTDTALLRQGGVQRTVTKRAWTVARMVRAIVALCADVAVMLAHNAYVTGQTISVNGGMYFAA